MVRSFYERGWLSSSLSFRLSQRVRRTSWRFVMHRRAGNEVDLGVKAAGNAARAQRPLASRTVRQIRRTLAGVLRRTVVVVQHAAYAATSANRSMGLHSPERLKQLVANTLMVPLAMVMRHELGNRLLKVALTKRGHAIQALSLIDRTNRSA